MPVDFGVRGSATWFARRLTMPGTGRPAWRAGPRMAVSLAVPLAVGLAIGEAKLGMIAALTAFFTALAEPAGGYRAHVRTYVWLGLAQAFIALLGALTSGTVIAAGVVGLAVGLVTGGIVASGSRISVAGPFPLLLFVVIQAVDAQSIWKTVAAAALGSAWVVVTAIAPALVAPFMPVELMVSDAWHCVALLSADPGNQRLQLMAAGAVEQARADLIAAPGYSARWHARRARLWAATEAAHRVGIAMVALAPTPGAPEQPTVSALLAETGVAAERIAHACRRPGRTADVAGVHDLLGPVAAAAPVAITRTATRMVARINDGANAMAGQAVPGTPPIPALTPMPLWRPLVESMRWGAPGLRHGLRLGIAAGGWMAISGYLGGQLPFVTHHVSWITITMVDVLAPSLGASVQRITQRAIGTAIGAMASALIIWQVGDPWILALIAVVAGGVAAIIRTVNYAWFMALFTPLVLLIVSTANPLGPEAAADRMAATIVGCAAGMVVAIGIWPSRTRDDVAHAVAMALRAIAQDVLDGLGLARRGGSVQDLSEVHRAAVQRTHHALQLLDGTAIEGLARRDRHDPLADLAGATMTLVDQTSVLGTRMPESISVVPGTAEPVEHMAAVLNRTADGIDGREPPPDPGDLTRELDPAWERLAQVPDPVAGPIVDALAGMLRATRAVAQAASVWVRNPG